METHASHHRELDAVVKVSRFTRVSPLQREREPQPFYAAARAMGKGPKASLKMKLSNAGGQLARAAVGAVQKKRKNKPGKPTNMSLVAVAGAGAKVTKPNAEPLPPKALHTLLLLQTTAATTTRTWSDFNSLPLALDAFIALYEKELRKLNPGLAKLTYSVADLHKYVDSLWDVSLMVSDPATKQYAPRGKPFLKDKLLEKLRAAAAP